ncbi:MAG: hypothetical protein AB8B91_20890 [Rubripirellula sp.]
MKFAILLALICIGGAVFYLNDGMSTLGFSAPQELPETITPRDRTFDGNEQTNPFVE